LSYGNSIALFHLAHISHMIAATYPQPIAAAAQRAKAQPLSYLKPQRYSLLKSLICEVFYLKITAFKLKKFRNGGHPKLRYKNCNNKKRLGLFTNFQDFCKMYFSFFYFNWLTFLNGLSQKAQIGLSFSVFSSSPPSEKSKV
jgi:hypothetical protein